MAISSETLFHFTPKPEYLFKILESNFRPRYYQEIIKMEGLNTPFNKAIPMICFCDIPLSQIKEHINTYGNYGIGMSKSWGIKNKLNPILYIEPQSILSESILSLLRNKPADKTGKKEGIYNVFRYMKNYKGDFFRSGKIVSNVKFYDEREWRYLPAVDTGIEFWLDDVDFNNHTALANHNRKAESYPLEFQPDDIKYLIIKDESEIPDMIRALRDIKLKYPEIIIDQLVSRIITTDQIKSDF